MSEPQPPVVVAAPQQQAAVPQQQQPVAAPLPQAAAAPAPIVVPPPTIQSFTCAIDPVPEEPQLEHSVQVSDAARLELRWATQNATGVRLTRAGQDAVALAAAGSRQIQTVESSYALVAVNGAGAQSAAQNIAVHVHAADELVSGHVEVAHPAAAVAPETAYLSAQQFLRLFVVFARSGANDVSGSGHLTAARAAVDNLMLLGFAGTLEVLHPDADWNQWTKRDMVGAGFPAFPDGGNMAGPGGTHCTVRYLTAAQLADAPTRDAGLINNLDIMLLDGDTLDDVVAGFNQQFGRRNILKVKKMVVLKAFGWAEGHRWIYNYENDRSRMLEVSDLAGYRAAAEENPLAGVAADDIAARVEGLVHPLIAADKPERTPLVRVLQRVCRGQIELLTGYGLHNGGSARTILSMARATRAAMTTLDAHKPVVILLLRNTIAPDAAFAQAGFRFIDATANGAADQITALAADQIAVVNAPGVHRTLFNQFMRSSTLPFFLEGAGTATTALTFGVPYVCLNDNPSIADVPDIATADTSTVLRAHGRWLTAAAHVPTDAEIAALGASLAAARTANSALDRYYRAAHAAYLSPANHQMALAFALLQTNPNLN